MGIQKFLELDSSYRNRNQDKDQASFTSTVSQSGIRSQQMALDPVTNAYPVSVFCLNSTGISSAEVDFMYYNSTNPNTTPIVNADSSTILYLCSTTFNSTASGFFTGCSLFIAGSPASQDQYRRIINWSYAKTFYNTSSKITYYYYKVTIEGPMSLKDDTTIQIFIPSDFEDTTYSYLFIPSSQSIPNYYNKYIVYNQDKNEYVKIISYDMDTHMARLDLTGTTNWDIFNDTYVIRQEPPVQFGSASSNGTTTAIPVQSSFIKFPKSFYQNAFVRVTSSSNTQNDNQIVKIVNINDHNNILVTPPLPAPIENGDNFEILQYSYDNYSPFVYTGTLASNSQPVAHEITLNSLTLPNVYLQSGGRIAYYPYVYVVLQNVSTTGGNPKNLIYSNNPNNYDAVFRAPITDLNHPASSPFVKLTGNGMKQTMSFKQNDDIRVSVLLPDGSLFTPIVSDNFFGQAPDPLLQLSMIFSMERI